MNVLKLDTKNQMTVIPLPKTLDEWYKELDCNTLTVTDRDICGRSFAIYADDEALLTGKPPVLFLDGPNKQALYNNVIFVDLNTDDEGNTLPLSEEDIKFLQEHIAVARVGRTYVRELFVVLSEENKPYYRRIGNA